ncbi:MAG: hypothetical protein K1W34_19925 [Lachnospiraceae bacterium]
MGNYKRYASVVLILVLCIGIAACSKTEDFDAEIYVKASLDAFYHGEYKEYADCLGISEDEARKQIEGNFEKSIAAQFEASEGISKEGITAYTEKMCEVKGLAKYEVLEAVETEDGNFTVKVQVEPSDVFQTLEKSAGEVSNELIAQGKAELDPDVFETVLCESVRRSIDSNTYGNPSAVEVKVTKDDSGAYILEEREMDRLEAAMFPGE